jgi:type I restriction enzyme S subunit
VTSSEELLDPWLLPSSWHWATIGEIADTTSGGTPRRDRPQFYGGSIPWVKSGELRDGIVHQAEESITEEALAASSAKLFPRGTVCIALYGATVGRLGILGIGASTNQAVCGIFPTGAISPWFVFRFLQLIRQQLVQLGKGGAQPNISQSIVRQTSVPVAPINEQQRILDEIDKQFTRLDAAVVALKRAQTNLKRYCAAVLKAACEGRLVPTEAELASREGRSYEPASVLLQRILAERRSRWEVDQFSQFRAAGKSPGKDGWKKKYKHPSNPTLSNDMPRLPDGWCWITAEQSTTMVTDGEHITPERSESGVLLLSARNILNGRISLAEVDYVSERVHEKLSRRLSIEAGDILLSCSGSVGRSCIAPEGLRFSLVRSVAVLKPVFEMGDYLSLALRSPFLQSQIVAKQTQTAQANIFQGKIKTLIFPLPPQTEQVRILVETERRLSIIEELVTEVQKALKKTERLRQSILKRAFEGKLLPQDPYDEPASVLLERIRADRNSALTKVPTARRGRRKKEATHVS